MSVVFAERKRTLREVSTELVLEKTDRILGQNVQVRFSDDVIAPGFTDGKTIYISRNYEPMRSELSKGFSLDGIAKVTGLNYHELAHCMFMPRLNSSLVQSVRTHGSFMAFNALQDQADESKFVHMYEPAEDYFTSLVTSYMMENDEYIELNYPLISGRLFLPPKLRRMFRDRYRKPKVVDRIDEIVSEYKTLVYPDNQDKMLDLIVEFQKIIDTDVRNFWPSHDQVKEGGVQSETVKRIIEDQREEEQNEPESTVGEDEASDEEGEDQAQGAGVEGVEDEPDESTEDDKQSDSSSGEESREDIKQELEEVYEASIGAMQEELQERIINIHHEQRNYQVREEYQKPWTRSPNPQLTRTAERCAEEFRLQNEKTAPGWHHRSRRGKLNPRRYVKALQGDEHVFRRWDEGVNDATDFEVVFLLDYSSSMTSDNKINHASDSLWVLRRSFDDLDGIVTVLGFGGHGLQLFSQRGKKADRSKIEQHYPTGMTYVADSIEEAQRVMTASTKAIKLIVIITDGMFTDRSTAEQKLNDCEYDVAIIGIRQEVKHYAELRSVIHAEEIYQATELIDVVKNLAIKLSNQMLTRRSHT